MGYVIPAPAAPSVAVDGSQDRFPVRRVYCVGRNYAEHAREMGHDPDREPPFFFMKPGDSLLPTGSEFPYPNSSENVHYEMEFVVAIGKGGDDIAEADALDHIWGYTVGLDMTRRDLQGVMKKLGRPWEAGKAFNHSAPISPLKPAASIGHPSKGRIWLKSNGEIVQDSDIAELIWNVQETISILSRDFGLEAGDLIYTGTPAGVGAVKRGDHLVGGVDGVGEVEIKVV